MTQIVAFTKDWTDVPTCTTHILREMAKTAPVLWVNSIGTRKPSLTTPHDLTRVWRRLMRLRARSEWKENNLRVLSPLLIPKPETRFSLALNRGLLSRYLKREKFTLGSAETEVWAFLPNAVVYRECLKDAAWVYYCVDDWSKFSQIDAAWIAALETRLLQNAHVVFATSRYLEEKCRGIAGDRVHYMPHGVEHAKFAAALAPETAPPAELAARSGPIVGFYGNICSWIDFDLVAELAEARPLWTFVMVGPVYCDVGSLRQRPNILLPGRQPHDRLPAWCKGFDVAMIPYDLGDSRMQSVNPVKAREILAAGVPIVASALPELEALAPDVLCAAGTRAWLEALETQLRRRDHAQISARRAADEWQDRVRTIRRIVEGRS
jgi:glycosyltransferase involved in cell wall biosynthesis